MSGSRILSSAIAMAVVLSFGVTTVESAIPNDGTYYACLTKQTGAVKVINYPKVKCAKGTRLIKWSQQGPTGPQGAQGPQGPAGPADWNAIANKPAGFADGEDNVGTPGYVTATVPCNGPIDKAGEYVIFGNLPRNQVHDFQVVPTGPGDYLYIVQVEAIDNGDGTIDNAVLIDDYNNSGTQTCNVRRITWTDGISVARAKQQLKKVEVSYAKHYRR